MSVFVRGRVAPRASCERVVLDIVGEGELAVLRDGTLIAPPMADPARRKRLEGGFIAAARAHFEGRLVLHGSAIAVGDGAVIVVGPKGRGKSTLTAAAVRAGYTALADGFVAVQVSTATVVPTFDGRVRLRDDSVAALRLSRVGELGSGLDGKAALLLSADGARLPASLPILAIYELAGSGASKIEVTSRASGAAVVAANGYFAPWFDDAARGELLDECVAIAQRVPCARLWRSNSYEDLPTVVADLVAHARRTAARRA